MSGPGQEAGEENRLAELERKNGQQTREISVRSTCVRSVVIRAVP